MMNDFLEILNYCAFDVSAADRIAKEITKRESTETCAEDSPEESVR